MYRIGNLEKNHFTRETRQLLLPPPPPPSLATYWRGWCRRYFENPLFFIVFLFYKIRTAFDDHAYIGFTHARTQHRLRLYINTRLKRRCAVGLDSGQILHREISQQIILCLLSAIRGRAVLLLAAATAIYFHL